MIQFSSAARRLRRALAGALCGALALGLCACGAPASAPAETEAPAPAQIEDATYRLTPEAVPQEDASGASKAADGGEPEDALQDRGALIAFAAGSAYGLDNGPDAAVWRGVQTFAATFGYAAQSFVTQDETPEACAAVLREAAESGAELVVCRGDAMAGALFEMQRSYPTVSYLLLEGEPHSEDYASYETTINTHCVLFAVEQAGYLAGYAAVREGYTALGFVGADSMPETVRYCTGMMQGAEAAAEREGQQVRLEVWLVGSGAAGDAVTARMSSWYADGVQLIVPAGGRLVESCIAAAQASGGRVLNAGWDAAALDPSVLSSTLLNYSVVTQRKLYDFFTAGNWGDQASRTERLDASAAAISLPLTGWPFSRFTREDYTELYTGLYDGTLRVERYSDLATLPETPNVAVNVVN